MMPCFSSGQNEIFMRGVLIKLLNRNAHDKVDRQKSTYNPSLWVNQQLKVGEKQA